ncbi:MAG: hypothetical protein PHQ74_06045 [Crocinitomicaceae bacterium]|nr:hypothetical protein [Crocinitomicaceae bacterium]
MYNSIYVLIILTCSFTACNRIKEEAIDVAMKTEQKVKAKSTDALDQVFPKFDAYTPDTKFNKKRFVEYLGVELSAAVKDIYCYGDFLGIDYKVLISFTCDSTTVQRIITRKKMEITADEDVGLNFSEEFPWWNKERIKILKPYKYGKEDQFWEYIWYDKANKKAYFEAFSL